MSEQRDSYEATKARLEEISAAARAKDVTLEKSIELLEEAVRLANLCTEHVDQVETFAVPVPEAADEQAEGALSGEQGEDALPGEDAGATDASDEAAADGHEDVPVEGEAPAGDADPASHEDDTTDAEDAAAPEDY